MIICFCILVCKVFIVLTREISAVLDKLNASLLHSSWNLVRDEESNELDGYRSLRTQNNIYHLIGSTFQCFNDLELCLMCFFWPEQQRRISKENNEVAFAGAHKAW